MKKIVAALSIVLIMLCTSVAFAVPHGLLNADAQLGSLDMGVGAYHWQKLMDYASVGPVFHLQGNAEYIEAQIGSAHGTQAVLRGIEGNFQIPEVGFSGKEELGGSVGIKSVLFNLGPVVMGPSIMYTRMGNYTHTGKSGTDSTVSDIKEFEAAWLVQGNIVKGVSIFAGPKFNWASEVVSNPSFGTYAVLKEDNIHHENFGGVLGVKLQLQKFSAELDADAASEVKNVGIEFAYFF